MIGSALAIVILSGGVVPIWAGVLVTTGDCFLLLLLDRLGYRMLEAVFALCIAIMSAAFGVSACIFVNNERARVSLVFFQLLLLLRALSLLLLLLPLYVLDMIDVLPQIQHIICLSLSPTVASASKNSTQLHIVCLSFNTLRALLPVSHLSCHMS